MDKNEIHDVEELEELDYSDDIIVETPPENKGDQKLLSIPYVEIWAHSYVESPVPLIILDRNLYIIWINEQFQKLFGDAKIILGQNLIDFYADSFNEEKKQVLFNHIVSKENAYSWKGQVAKKGRQQLTINSNLLLLPVFASLKDIMEPVAFVVILDDVSGEYKSMLRNTFLSLLEASKLKDNDTGNHIERVNRYSKILAESIMKEKKYKEIDREFLEEIGFLAALHDVGKIGTPDNILNKQGTLNEWEWGIMQEHTINGAYILSTYPSPMAREIALFHHEHWDGTGYPYGLSKEMIPLSSRIVAIADVYDALRMERSYKEAFNHKKAAQIIVEGKGKHFDPILVNKFIKTHKTFAKIFESLKDEAG
jgi:HD-GYP domain-containing protein (c-di-GMP phosphodiesterase class II)